MSRSPQVKVRHVPERSRVEARADDDRVMGFSQYVVRDGAYVFFHTEVDSAFEGQGIGGRIAAGVMEFVRDSGKKILPQCPFIRGYMRKHPDTQDLLAKGATLTPDRG
jgi:predicted GNAT family acetyltransferase